jgi:hypothetical protein
MDIEVCHHVGGTPDIGGAMRAGRIFIVILGALLSVVGFGATVGGGALMFGHLALRDDAGYYNSPTQRLETSTAALMTTADISAQPGDWSLDEPLGTLRVRANSVDETPLFVGVAPAKDVEAWLAGADYERITAVRAWPFRVDTELLFGADRVTAPGAERFWVASASGVGPQTLTWPIERGDWAVVLMNADGQTGIAADVSAGVETGLMLPVGLVLTGFGVLLLLVGLVVMLVAVGRYQPVGAVAPGRPLPAGAYPVRLDGTLDPRLSRWMWLVKWFLAIPHLIVIALLWLAVVPLTVVAGVAIVFTGRYPRAIFEFNVGVLRWTWRVQYYAFYALGTDRYPPFTLHSDPNYPADLAIDYPQRLSRGLVLVKWWLLAIPHYIVVGLFTGGWLGWSFGYGDDSSVTASFSLIGILVIVAVVILAFTGRYPQPLFDFVMGMNRWCYRVLGYVMLMRDEYPPFRLDNGGTDPGSVPQPPPPDRTGELARSSTATPAL